MSRQLAQDLVKLLSEKRLTLSVAESITGGGLASTITAIPGSSQVFLGGFITYSDAAKKQLLGIPQRLLTKESAVSEAVALEMAKSVRVQCKSDYSISTTGVAGPGSAYGQEAGTVWIAIASAKEAIATPLALTGDREIIRNATIESALALLSRTLLS